MSYKYNPYTDTFTHTDDEQPIRVDSSTILYQTVMQVELSDECIQKIAERVVELIKDAKMDEVGL